MGINGFFFFLIVVKVVSLFFYVFFEGMIVVLILLNRFFFVNRKLFDFWRLWNSVGEFYRWGDCFFVFFVICDRYFFCGLYVLAVIFFLECSFWWGSFIVYFRIFGLVALGGYGGFLFWDLEFFVLCRFIKLDYGVYL